MGEETIPRIPESLGTHFLHAVAGLLPEHRILASGEDRHGALQWIVDWHHGDIVRIVEFDVIEARAGWDFEAWAGAESGRRFTRRLVGTGATTAQADSGYGAESSSEAVAALTINAVEYAAALREEALDSIYQFAGRSQGQTALAEPDALSGV